MVLSIISCLCAGIAAVLVVIAIAIWTSAVSASSCTWNSYTARCDCIINGNRASLQGDVDYFDKISINFIIININITIISINIIINVNIYK